MNFQKYGYTKWQTKQFNEYFGDRKYTSYKRNKIASKRGWQSRQDADDDIYGSGGGYYRRAYLLPSHVTSFSSGCAECNNLTANKEIMFHHKVLCLPSFCPFQTETKNINILEFLLDFHLELMSTQTILKEVTFYVVLIPDPYPSILQDIYASDAPVIDEEGLVVKPKAEGYPEDSRDKVYNRANCEIRRMMMPSKEQISLDIDPFKNTSQFCVERYSITQKSFKIIKNGQDGKFHINFKFKSSPKNGDINLRQNEGIFVIGKCYCESSIANPIFYTHSNIGFRYSVN